MAESILTAEILEEPHTARDYLSWARSLVQKLKTEPNGIERIRMRIGLAKELMNEAIPIGLLAAHYFNGSDDVRIALKIGSQIFDATVCDNRISPSSVSHLEVTVAQEGETEHLRMLHLHQTGEVSGLGTVTKHGTRRTGLTVNVEREMVSQHEVLHRERDRLSKAIDRKLDKPYPPNTLLVIAFDDTMAFDRADNIANLNDVLLKYTPKLTNFHSVAIVGLHNGLFIHKQTGAAI